MEMEVGVNIYIYILKSGAIHARNQSKVDGV